MLLDKKKEKKISPKLNCGDHLQTRHVLQKFFGSSLQPLESADIVSYIKLSRSWGKVMKYQNII